MQSLEGWQRVVRQHYEGRGDLPLIMSALNNSVEVIRRVRVSVCLLLMVSVKNLFKVAIDAIAHMFVQRWDSGAQRAEIIGFEK